MLDIKFIRENPDVVRQALASRQDSAPLDDILRLEAERRRKVGELDNLRQQRKAISKEREKAQEKGRELRAAIQDMEEEVRRLDEQLEELLMQVPNIPQPDVPVGRGSDDNVTMRTWGEPKAFDFEPAPHWQLGESLGIIDFERGIKLAGSRFYVLRGEGARLQRALIALMLDTHISHHGYTEIYPPFMVKRECMVGSGQLPKFADNIYHDA
jgi:seryl-tRNA synthetase